MPRKNRKTIIMSRQSAKRYEANQIAIHESKRRYISKREAERVADYQMLEHPEVSLRVYSWNGGWYLTSQEQE